VKKQKKVLEPLKLSCNTADCPNDLHCFRKSKRLSKHPQGRCQYCGEDLVDWPRVQKQDLTDVKNTFKSLKHEWIRHHYWELEFPKRVLNHAKRKGRVALDAAVEKRLRQAISLPKKQNPYDGRQTPFKGKAQTVITCAQHAVACCCRTCIEYWHGIPVDMPLSEEHISYFKKLVLMYIDERLPDLYAEPQAVPNLRGESDDEE
jgi:hypothetical protein